MTTDREATSQWKTTVIISSSIQNHESSRILTTQQHRIRFSDGITTGAFIFPLSGIGISEKVQEIGDEYKAFIEKLKRGAKDIQELPENFEEVGLMDRIRNFVEIHRNCFLLLYAPFYGPKELQTLKVIQNRFFGSNLKILTVQNYAEMVKGMLIIVKATSKPHVDSIRDRMLLARAHIIETSPVWEFLRDMLLKQDVTPASSSLHCKPGSP